MDPSLVVHERKHLSLQFQLSVPAGRLETESERLLNVVADFQLLVGDQILLSEAQFPIVELACQLDRWLEQVAEAPREFVYTSLGSDVPGIIRISRGQKGWHFSTAFAEFADDTSFTLEEVVLAVRAYLEAVGDTVFAEYGFRLSDVGAEVGAEVGEMLHSDDEPS